MFVKNSFNDAVTKIVADCIRHCKLKSFEDVLVFLGAIPDLHEGGCGIAALSCYRWLEKNNPEKLSEFSVIYCYYEEEGRRYAQNYSSIESKNYKEIWTPPHVVVLYEGTLLESGGGDLEQSDFKLFHAVPVEFLIDNLKYGAWNYIFSRFVWCPVIEEVLNISLQDVIQFQQRNEDKGFSEIIGNPA